jgi:hypothetical protein
MRAGARLRPACEVTGITVRTLQRWKAEDGLHVGDRRPWPSRPTPAHALTDEERETLLRVANEPRFADMPPARIVPTLADEGVYLASESSFQRVLRGAGQSRRRGRAKAPRASRPPSTHVATAPRQLWAWDMSYLPADVAGRWFYLYLILDVFSRKIVGFEVHDTDDASHAAHLARRAALAEGIHAMTDKPVLHGDNGSDASRPPRCSPCCIGWADPAVVLAPARERRQRVRREPVSHGEVPPGVPRHRLRRSRGGARLGEKLRALVQPRAPAQRHPFRQPRPAPRRARCADPRTTPSTLPAGPHSRAASLVATHAKLVARGRRHAESRARKAARAGHCRRSG